MKQIVIILLICIFYYLTINKKAQKEHFSPERDFNHPNDKWTYYDPHTNQFRLLKNVEDSILKDSSVKLPPAFNGVIEKDNIYTPKPWIVTENQYSGMFNNEKVIKKTVSKKTKRHDIKQQITYLNKSFQFIGFATNKYYNQKYILYEMPRQNNPNEKLEFKTYEYLLVTHSRKNNNYNIEHNVGPRVKINDKDQIHLSFGVYQIGPLLINLV